MIGGFALTQRHKVSMNNTNYDKNFLTEAQKTLCLEKSDIDVNFDFTTDSGYWDTYHRGRSLKDPDTYSPRLRLYQQILYSRTLPCGKYCQLEQGKNVCDDYLYWNGTRFSSDSIINMYAYRLPEIEKDIENYEDKIESYIRKGYTIGGEILFPRRQNSINQCRGTCAEIQDRFDLTLECIRRFYEGKDSPLYGVLKADEEFFKLFVDFKGFVDFLFLNDLVSEDYTKIKFFLGDDNDLFNRTPFPKNKDEWEQLYNKQMEFLQQRNDRIKRFITMQ